LEISIPKSVVPEQCSIPAAELAKRLFVAGQEITPVPPEAILEYSQPYGLRSLLESSIARGYQLAVSPYPVQSIPRTNEEWRLLTFPFRNALPQLNGVKCLFPVWEETGEPPAGLDPGWFVWCDTSNEVLRSLIQEFILNEASKAETASYQLIHKLSFTVGSMNPLEASLPQGGDWQPGLARCHPQIVLTVLRESSQRLMEMSFGFGDPNQTDEDLYAQIGKFHIFLDPDLMVFGRKFDDQKTWTRRTLQKIVKFCINRINNPPENPWDDFGAPSV
jgi:hypothetical protein